MKANKTADKSTVSVIGKHTYAVTCEVGQQKHRTDVVQDLFDNPTFNKQFQFQVDSLEQMLVLLVTEKREKDVVGQIAVPLTSVDSRPSDPPIRVPLQRGLLCTDLFSSPGELVYDVWIAEHPDSSVGAIPDDRSLTSRTTARLSRLRRRLNSSPIVSSTSRWNEFKNSRRYSTDVLFDLRSAAVGFQLADRSLSFDEGSVETQTASVSPPTSPDGYVKRSSLWTVSESCCPRPQVLEVVPAESPTAGGTAVTVRGRDLGLSRDDVIALSICGSSVVQSVQYISPERLVCTTNGWKPCVGRVSVETASGGRSNSSVQFTFIATSDCPRSRPMMSDRFRRSVGSVESLVYSDSSASADWNTGSSCLPGEQDYVVRRFSASDTTPAARPEMHFPVAEVQPMKVSPDSPRIQAALTGKVEVSHLKLYTAQESQDEECAEKEQTVMTELNAQLVSNRFQITELVEENKSLKEQYANLQHYINGLLVRVFDACPQLLCVDLQ